MGAQPYLDSVILDTPVGKAIKKVYAEDKNGRQILFNSAYYLTKQERPFSDFSDLLKLQEKNKTPGIKECYRYDRAAANFGHSIAKVTKESFVKDLAKACYFCILSEGSTDSSVTEEELVHVLLLLCGKPKLKCPSIEPANNANAEGIHSCIKEAFGRVGVLGLSQKVIVLNVDGAVVNTGIHHGALMKESSPWLQVIHCFNHILELSIKDAFKTDTCVKIDKILMKMCYLYQKSPKRLRELQRMSEAWEKSVSRPSKSHDTRWIDHKLKSMQIVLENYGVFLVHVESLSQTNSQA